jgi:hypothetical protein
MTRLGDVMTKRRRIAVLLLATVVLGGVVWWTLVPREPTYQERTLSSWLNDLSNVSPAVRKPAEKALLAMGTNNVPCLLKMWCAQESDLSLRLKLFLDRKKIVKLWPTPREIQRVRGLNGLWCLANHGLLAAPPIIQLLANGKAPPVDAGETLARIDENNINPLLEWGRGTNFGLRLKAICALSGMGGMVSTNFEYSVGQVLRIALADPNPQMRLAAEEATANWVNARNDSDFLLKTSPAVNLRP